MAYALGTEVQLVGTFANASNETADPSAVMLYIAPPGTPNGTSTQYSYAGGQITRSAQGVYTMNVILNKPGVWTYAWEGTGAVQAATFDTSLVVQPSILRTQ